MTQTNSVSWYETGWFKGIGAALGVLTALAVVIPWLFQPRTDLQAIYRQVSFQVPEYLKGSDGRDSAIARRDTAIAKYYSAFRDLTFKQKLYFPDSLRPSNLIKEQYRGLNPTYYFAGQYEGLITLTVVNTGDKSLTNLKVVYPRKTYYEFVDSEGKLHRGQSIGKFSIGELDAQEKRDVVLWVPTSENYGRDEISIIYGEGVLQATQPVELTGKPAWLIKHWGDIAFFGFFGSLVTLFILGLIAKARENAASKEQQA